MLWVGSKRARVCVWEGRALLQRHGTQERRQRRRGWEQLVRGVGDGVRIIWPIFDVLQAERRLWCYGGAMIEQSSRWRSRCSLWGADGLASTLRLCNDGTLYQVRVPSLLRMPCVLRVGAILNACSIFCCGWLKIAANAPI